jgi:hypothetical protein
LDESSGGLFYAGSQKTGSVTLYRVDFSQAGNNEAVNTGVSYSFGLVEVSGLGYNAADDDIYAASDNDQTLVIFDKLSGKEKSRRQLPYQNIEGIAPVNLSGSASIFFAKDDGASNSAIYHCQPSASADSDSAAVIVV